MSRKAVFTNLGDAAKTGEVSTQGDQSPAADLPRVNRLRMRPILGLPT